jgi:hypothetical protein|tara:strand:- start:231 stop:428 length:198 start_codon:yes stop_codon:yes gene_type:complete
MIKTLIKRAVKATGIVAQDADSGEDVSHRKKRLGLSALVVAVLVDLGLETHIAETLVDLVIAILG